eukprot:augustus_masked-scaffold_13-processed-gene-1.10-mRNA-1 protein AED:1.00 eAED:1.00 QI:0/-1/0/0/-1/1/1/0/682
MFGKKPNKGASSSAEEYFSQNQRSGSQGYVDIRDDTQSEAGKSTASSVRTKKKRKTAAISIDSRGKVVKRTEAESTLQRPNNTLSRRMSIESDSFSTFTSVATLGKNGKTEFLNLRTRARCQDKFIAVFTALLSLAFLGAAGVSTTICWTEALDNVASFEYDGETRGSACKASNIFTEKEFEENLFIFGELVPYFAFMGGLIFLAITLFYGCTNSTKGCLRGKKIQVKEKAMIKNFFLSFTLFELCGYIFKFSFVLNTFDLGFEAGFTQQSQILFLASLFLAFPAYAYKLRHYKDVVFSHKKRLVGLSAYLIAVEDLVFIYVQVAQVLQLYDNIKLLEDQVESQRFQVEVYFLFGLVATVLVFCARFLYIGSFVCCASPIFDDDIHYVKKENPEGGEALMIATIFPRDVITEVRVNLEGHSVFQVLIYGVLPALISLAVIVLFIVSVIQDFDEPELEEDSLLREDFVKYGVLIGVVVVELMALWLYFGFKNWIKGCCKTEDGVQKVARKSSFLFSVRTLERVDFITDIGSVYYIFNSFRNEQFWQIMMIASLAMSLILNTFHEKVELNTEQGYQREKKLVSLSLALLGAEDLIMVPLNAIFVYEFQDEFPSEEIIAVILSAAVGGVLFLYRVYRLIYIIAFAPIIIPAKHAEGLQPDASGEINLEIGTLPPSVQGMNNKPSI